MWTNFSKYSHQNSGTRSRPCTWALNDTWVLGVSSVWMQYYFVPVPRRQCQGTKCEHSLRSCYSPMQYRKERNQQTRHEIEYCCCTSLFVFYVEFGLHSHIPTCSINEIANCIRNRFLLGGAAGSRDTWHDWLDSWTKIFTAFLPSSSDHK